MNTTEVKPRGNNWIDRCKAIAMSFLKWAGIIIAGGILYSTIWPFILSVISNMGHGVVGAFKDSLIFLAANTNASSTITIVLLVFISGALFMSSSFIGKSVKLFIKARQNNSSSECDLDENKKKDVNPKKLSSRYLGFSIIFMIYTLLISIFLAYPLTLRVSFEVAIDRITPYTNMMEINKYKSRWVEMDSYDEYISIKNDINLICIDNGLKHDVLIK